MTNGTVVVSTYKRPIYLDRCLKSVVPLHFNIIIVDNAADQETLKVAKKYSAEYIICENSLMLNVNKNYGFLKANTEWILSLDDDEELSNELCLSIVETVKRDDPAIAGVWIPRKNIIFGKWIRHGVWWPDAQLRLFRKGKGRFPEKHVHEYIQVDGDTSTLDIPFLHHNYHSIEQFLYKMEYIYTPSEVNKLEAQEYVVGWYDAIRFPISDFIKVYFAQKGYKDGLHGLVLSILQAFYMFIVFVKLWEKDGFSEVEIPLSDVTHELSQKSKESAYWALTSLMAETSNSLFRFWYQIKRFIIHHWL